MLIALQKVPHLADVCAKQTALKELRSICKEAMPYADELISGLQIDFRRLFNNRDAPSLVSVLKASTLRRLHVVLDLESQGELN